MKICKLLIILSMPLSLPIIGDLTSKSFQQIHETKADSLPFCVPSDSYDLNVVGTGLTHDEDSGRPNSVRFSDTTTYIEVVPKSGQKLADSTGLTISFWQKNSTNTYGGGSTGTNEFERYLGFKDANGNFAYYCPGGVTYDCSATSSGYAYKNTYNVYAMLNTTWKYVTVTFDFVNNSMDAYYNGTLFNSRNRASSADSFWNKYINVIKQAALEDGGQILFRGQFANSDKQTKTSSFDALEFTKGCLSSQGVKNKFEQVRECNIDINVVNKKESEYEVSVHGQVANVYDKDHKNAIWFSKYDQYISISPKSGNLVGNDGFTFSFWEKCLRKSTSTSDVNASFQSAVGNDFMDSAVTNNDAWVNILHFNGETDLDGAICSSAIWSTKETRTATYYTDATNRKLLMSNEWQYVSIVVDFKSESILYYLNGVEGASCPAGTALQQVIEKAKYQLTNGGAINFRKPLSIREYRNHSGLEFSSFTINDRPLSSSECSALYTEEIASDYVKLVFSENEVEVIKEKGVTVVLSDYSVPGKTIKGWYKNKDLTEKYLEETITVVGKNVLYADTEYLTYKINYHLFGGTNNPANPTSFNCDDDELLLLAPSKDGYVFDAWYRDDKFINRQTKIQKGTYGDIDLYAHFKAIKYSLTYNLDGGVFVEQPKEYYIISDEPFRIPDAWKGGYVFIGWFNGETKVETIDPSIKQNLVLTAKFKLEGEQGNQISPLILILIIAGSVVAASAIGVSTFLIIKKRKKHEEK